MKFRELSVGCVLVLFAVSLMFMIPASAMSADDQQAGSNGVPDNMTDQKTQQTGVMETESAEEVSKLNERINQSIEVIREMMDRSGENISPELIQNSAAIAIFPDVTKVAIGIGGRYGGGVMMLHQNNEWTGPVYISLYGASVGAQLGAEQTDLVMIFNNQSSLEKFSDGELQLGAEASIAAGSWGAKAGASTQADVLAYQQTAGIFAGVALSGAVLNTEDQNNKAYFGEETPYSGNKEVFTGQKKLPETKQTTPLVDALNQYVQQK